MKQPKKTVLERAEENFGSKAFTRAELRDLLGYDAPGYLTKWTQDGVLLAQSQRWCDFKNEMVQEFQFVRQGSIEFPQPISSPDAAPDYGDEDLRDYVWNPGPEQTSPPPITDEEVDEVLKAFDIDSEALTKLVEQLTKSAKSWMGRALKAERALEIESKRRELLHRNTKVVILHLRKEVEALA